jgi:hypothetical protein
MFGGWGGEGAQSVRSPVGAGGRKRDARERARRGPRESEKKRGRRVCVSASLFDTPANAKKN